MRARAVARVNVAAIERNVARLRGGLAGGAALCAVVKADGYGHGAVATARAALAGGATWIAVVAAAEAAELRDAGIDARLLVMGALTPDELELALDASADIVVWREDVVAALDRPARVHVKLDTGMGRLGTRDPEEATRVAAAVARSPHLELAGAMTHFATADEPGDAFFGEQLERFTAWARPLRERHPGLVVHAANSAATLREPRAHFDMVRAGIAIYGLDPFQDDAAGHGLEPALELLSYVAEVKPCAPGESAGYGRRFVADRPTMLATVPIGYGDGVRRALSDNADVLVGGRRRPLRGTVSMDNITLDAGADARGVARGADAVLIGAQGGERVTAEEWARRMSTINYEVTCAISRRVPREHHRDGVALR
ncbi:MAG: alanine racemase [Solirubrobacteraceae bacterium]|nr:alanine racemase [Solirubrobacteraceae bacterium]